MAKNYFEDVNTIQNVMGVTVNNARLLEDVDFLTQFRNAWELNKCNQIGKYGKYQAEIGISADEFLGVIRTLLSLEKIRVYVGGKRQPDINLSIRYSEKPYGLNVSGDTKAVREYIKAMGFKWNRTTSEWWTNFRTAPTFPAELPKAIKLEAEKPVKAETVKAEKPKKTETAAPRKLEGDEKAAAIAEFKAKVAAKRKAEAIRKKQIG